MALAETETFQARTDHPDPPLSQLRSQWEPLRVAPDETATFQADRPPNIKDFLCAHALIIAYVYSRVVVV